MNINMTLLGQSFPIILLLCAGIFFGKKFIKNKKLANLIAAILIAVLLLPYLILVLIMLYAAFV